MNRDEQIALARQLRCPLGEAGIVVGDTMSVVNARMNQVAFEDLDAGPRDRVLEIGFGPGALLERLLSRSSRVAGLDLSLTMARETRRRLGAGARVCCGSAQDLPYGEQAFTKICTVNTVYFWEDLRRAFTECRRVLRPGGALVVCFNADYELAKESWDRFGFTLCGEEQVVNSLRSAGFPRIDRRMERDPEQGEFFSLCAS